MLAKLKEQLPLTYKTAMMVTIKDYMIGIVSWILTIATFLYIGLYVFWYQRQFEITEKQSGYVYYDISGSAYSQNYDGSLTVWDEGDLFYPELDNQGFFVAVKIFRVKGQTMDNCTTKCKKNEDCKAAPPLSHGECLNHGFCKEPSWCPNIDAGHTKAEAIEILGLENLEVKIWSGIEFEQLDSEHYIGHENNNKLVPYPQDGANLFNVMDIIKAAGISDVEDIHSTGAIIRLTFDWNCDVEDDDCTPNIEIERLDGDSDELPFLMNRVYHYDVNGVDTRDYYRYIGIKVMLNSRGKGREFSLHMTILQVASLLALLKMAKDITDFIMLNCYSKKKRAIYKHLKIEESVDFSDKMEHIDLLKYQRQLRKNEKR